MKLLNVPISSWKKSGVLRVHGLFNCGHGIPTGLHLRNKIKPYKEGPARQLSWFITPTSMAYGTYLQLVNGFIDQLTSLGGPTL